MELLKKWWPTILAIIVAVWGVVGTQIQAVISAHPVWVTSLGAAGVIVAHLLPSPVKSSS